MAPEAQVYLDAISRLRSERETAQWYISEQQARVPWWSDAQRRWREDDAMIRGEFHVVFPDESSVVEKPKVPNRMQLQLQDYVGAASSVMFSHRCIAPNRQGQARASKRERIVAHYREINSVPAMLPYYYADLIVCGVNYKLVLPDFETGFPCIQRRDPRHAYPDHAIRPDSPPSSVIFSYAAPLSQIAAEHPDVDLGEIRRGLADARASSRQRRGGAELVQVSEYYDRTEWARVASVRTRNKGTLGAILRKHLSELKRLPLAVAVHPSFDGQFRGMLDQVVGPLATENRIANLMIDSAVDWIYSPIQYFDIANPEDWGTGRPIKRTTSQGFMGRVPAGQPAPAAGSMLGSLQDTSREAAVHPRARSGEIPYGSGSFVQSTQGGMSTALALLQRTEAASWAQALSLALEIDEKYLDTGETKYIEGTVETSRFSTSYRPSVHIKGEYGVQTEFGGAAGGDEFSYEVRLYQAVDRGIVPRRVAMLKSPFIGDVLEAEQLVLVEKLTDAGLQFVAARAAQGDFGAATELIESLDDPEADVLEILAAFYRQHGQPTPGTGMEAAQEAGALFRGLQGVPGAENVPGLAGLPSLPPASLDEIFEQTGVA